MIAPRRVFAMASKEMRHIVRDRQLLGFALVMPVVLLLLFGYAVSFDIEHIPFALVDQDRTAASRSLAQAFTSADLFQDVARPQDPDAITRLFRRDAARAALVIPRGYGRSLARGEEATAQLLVDGSDNMTASIALGYGNALAAQVSQQAVSRQLGAMGPALEARTRTFFNPALKSAVFLVPGLMALVLTMIAVMLTALTVAREYERGSMEQLFATPVGRLEIILGKLGPYFALGLLQVLLVLTLGVALFDVPVRGSLVLLFAVASLFLLAMLTQGLVVSIVTRSQMVASQIATISTLLPALLLSGFVFPIDNMPLPIQVVARAMPATYLVDALRAVLLRGSDLAVIWPDCAAMGAFFLVMLVIATRRFRRSVA